MMCLRANHRPHPCPSSTSGVHQPLPFPKRSTQTEYHQYHRSRNPLRFNRLQKRCPPRGGIIPHAKLERPRSRGDTRMNPLKAGAPVSYPLLPPPPDSKLSDPRRSRSFLLSAVNCQLMTEDYSSASSAVATRVPLRRDRRYVRMNGSRSPSSTRDGSPT